MLKINLIRRPPAAAQTPEVKAQIGISQRAIRARIFAPHCALNLSSQFVCMAEVFTGSQVTDILSPRNFAGSAGATIAEWGGKAYNLAQSLPMGQNVPEFFVVKTSTFREFMAANNMPERIDQKADFKEISRLFQEAQLPAHIKREISAKCDAIRAQHPECKFAVRSSSTIEDSPKYSFAGKYATRLNCTTHEEVERAVKEVLASLYSPGVQNYKSEMHIPEREEMAVIIQRMVPKPKYAGVIYAPLPTDPTKIGIEYAYEAYGEGIVDGSRSPHIIDLDNKPPYELVFVDEGTGFGKTLMSTDGRDKVRVLIDSFKKCAPGEWDLEFCIDEDGELYLLQNRRITDVEPQAPFTIDEIRSTIDPAKIIFESEIARGISPRAGVVCEVFVDERPEGYLSGLINLDSLFSSVDRYNRNYAIALNHFPDTLDHVDEATPHKKVVLTVEYAGRNSHILTIMRTKRKGLLYAGVKNQPELLGVLQQQQWIRVIMDGRKALILKAEAPPKTNENFNVVSVEHDKGTYPQHKRIELEVEFLAGYYNTPVLAESLTAFLVKQGIHAGMDDSMSWLPIYPKDHVYSIENPDPWGIAFSAPYREAVFARVSFDYDASSVNVAEAFKKFFGIKD
ncbi:MAG: PEP/pyruvate-binding domain-containing protein [Candidatus Margulisbacteria bacterium]|nr:PEP/pyruvate-binding domain-containing protein [Candidatus Margulisiibacteriota bacterium]